MIIHVLCPLQELKNQITEYEKLCFNVGETKRAFTPPPPLSPPPLVTSTRPATSQQEEEKEEKVSAFVDAVIQRSQQALLDDEGEFVMTYLYLLNQTMLLR